jgi:SAM-dependent methyltransferase
MPAWQELKKRLKPGLRRVPGFRAARFIRDLLRGVESRNTALMLLRPPEGLFQPYGTTSENRYPEIFQLARDRLGDTVDLRLLSFGCATGEEAFALRRHFPLATIVGLDINRYNIAVCRSRLRRAKDSRMIFVQSASTAAEPDSNYDAIFAMAVFRHGDLNVTPPPPKCDHRLHFAEFEQAVSDLARCLKPGGLLVLHHAMFRFSDTSVAAQFEPVISRNLFIEGPLYDRNNCSLPINHYPYVVFRKLPQD